MPSMIFEFDVELDTGEKYSVVADQRDVARWEVQPFGWPIVRMEDQASMVFFRFLAWSAATRQQLTALPWEKYNEQLIEALPPDDEEGEEQKGEGGVPADAEDPGQPAPSATRSSPSRGKRASR